MERKQVEMYNFLKLLFVNKVSPEKNFS